MKFMQVCKQLSAIGVCLTTASACSFFSSTESPNIDPPQIVSETQPPLLNEHVQQESHLETRLQTIYVQDEQGYLTPISVKLPKTASPARTALQYMVADGPVSSVLPAGFRPVLPKGTEIKGINISPTNKQATVDFSAAFATYAPESERKMLEAVTWTLTNFPSIDSVQFRIEGKHIQEMPVAKTPVDQPWSRKMGINLEKATEISYRQSTPVTLYFMNQTKNNNTYYVPITRMIKRTDQLEKAVVEQLIAGPLGSSYLHSAVHSTAELQDISSTEKLITLDFNQNLVGPDQKVPEEAVTMLVLSLSENTGIEHIQLKVNGIHEVSSQVQSSFAKPVTRPKHVNLFEL